MNNYAVRLIALPPKVRGCVTIDADGFYSIYINESLTYEQRREVFLHELTHIRRNHFYDTRPVAELEREADGEAKGR